jgi:WD40 repeat protein
MDGGLDDVPDRWHPAWATATELDARHRGSLDGHQAPVRAVATTTMDGRAVALTADAHGILATWDLATGRLLGSGIRATDEGPVLSVATAALDGRPVAVTGGHDGKVRVWDLPSQDLIAGPFTGHGGHGGHSGHAGSSSGFSSSFSSGTGTGSGSGPGPVWSVATTTLGSRPAVISGGADRTVRVWDLRTGAELRPPEPSLGEVTAVAATTVAGKPWVFTGDSQGSIMTWALDVGQVKSINGHHDRVIAVAVTHLDGRAVGISSSHDKSIRVWDLQTGELIGDALELKAPAWSIEVMLSEGRPVLVAARADGDVAFIDLATREAVEEPVRGHADAVYAVAVSEIDGHPILVSGGKDNVAQVWDLAARPFRVDNPLPARGANARSASFVQAPGGPAMAVIGDDRGTLWLRDAHTGALLAEPLSVHTDSVMSSAVALLDGKPIAVTAGLDQRIRVWDLSAGAEIGAPQTVRDDEQILAPCVATAVLRGRPIVATAKVGYVLWVWDLADQRVLWALPPTETDLVLAVAAAYLGGRPVFVAGNGDGTVRMWDAESGGPVGAPMSGHEGLVTTVATAVLDGRPIAVAGGQDGTVRVWDLATCTPVGAPLAVHTDVIRSVAVTELDGRPVAVSGGDDRVVRTCDLRTGAEAAPPYATPYGVRQLVPTDGGLLVVAGDTLLLTPATPLTPATLPTQATPPRR